MDEIGLFPLGLVLLPAEQVPLHIFEPRYRELIGESLEHGGPFGIVYADDVESPRIVKIYDPNNLGSSCGTGKHPHPPGWIMSRVPPVGLERPGPLPESRKRWWRSLFGS